nr:uncharacterized protein LOC109157051 [Ipomoea batatas]
MDHQINDDALTLSPEHPHDNSNEGIPHINSPEQPGDQQGNTKSQPDCRTTTVTLSHKGENSDPSLFTKGENSEFIALLVYVDDILVASANMNLITELKSFLDKTFKIKDLGTLEGAGFLGCKLASTPMVHNLKLTHDGTPLIDATEYRRLVGQLLYLTATRPGISYAIQQLSQFVDALTDQHLSAALRVLR